ncbi:hypothetical protein SAMN05421664_3535 [Chryseobacterium soldanellicola]|uniref:Uncharacterized protein n=1 Tax=Chryseobacterium soldanellicola TaxID=311333 RepID=A0A1H1GAH5_9FLAO|nr:hypothetical protein [Chryseobacterium soldanellicola]SDR09836.1 hypothetical protein SAMN05421664_3535 [Chryseobacterium soldanellicola]
MNKKFILRLLLLVAISISLHSCRNELLNEQHTAVNPNASKFRMVKLKNIPNVENFIYQESGRKDMKVPLRSASISGKQDLTIGDIETSAIVEANYGTDVYYVFKVENMNTTDAVYNLEVKKTNGQVVKAEIIEYNPKDGTYLDFQHFTGSVTSYSLDGSVNSMVGFNDGVGDCPPIPGTPGGNGDSGGTIDPGDVPPPNGGWYNGGNGPKDEVPWGDNPKDCTDLILDSHGNTIGWYDHCLNETHLNPIAHKTSSTDETDNLSADCNGDGSGVIITNPTTPCEKTKVLIQKQEVKDKVNALYNQSMATGEKAFMVKTSDGLPDPLIDGEEHSVQLGNTDGYSGYYHNHTKKGINIFSCHDIYKLFEFIKKLPPDQSSDVAFGGMVDTETSCPGCTSTGGIEYFNFLVRFNGSRDAAAEIKDRNYPEDDLDDLEDKYQDFEQSIRDLPGYSSQNGNFFSFKGLEEVFFNALDKMNIDKNKIILQRIDKSGKVYSVTLDANGKPKETPCPQ